MSFRARLTTFFLLIVVLPMVAIAVFVITISNDSASGKADARLSEGLVAASDLYRDDLQASNQAATAISHDLGLANAIRSGDNAAIASAARRAAKANGVRSLSVTGQSGSIVRIGPAPFAGSKVVISAPGSGDVTVGVATTTLDEYAAEVRRRTALDALVTSGKGSPLGTLDPGGADLPGAGDTADVSVAGNRLRAATVQLPGNDGLSLTVVGARGSTNFLSSRPLVVAALVIFFAIALLFAARVLAALNARIRHMLTAAQQIGDGDFSNRVPVEGNDEMAGLAREFNKMSERLEAQIAQLRRQRDEIERSVRQIGQAFASGLDRDGLLRIVTEAATSACSAEYGIVAISGRLGGEVETGTTSSELRDATVSCEEEASREGRLVEHWENGIAVISSPVAVPGEPARRGGVMSVARRGGAFDAGEREVFSYLLGQMAISIENIALHEVVSEQAVTDDLTGLSNKRRFREMLAKEAARAQRFGHDLSLLILDIDDFKRVNDTYGHLQGDEVLRGVARAIARESRGIDEPARYGGEEFVVALPETDSEGAIEMGERIRTAIESMRVARIDGGGELGVTASVGVTTSNGAPNDLEGLIEAADSALYAAKAAGKNRVIEAEAPV